MSKMPDMSKQLEFYKNQETIGLLNIYLEITEKHKERFFGNKIPISNQKEWNFFCNEVFSLAENLNLLTDRAINIEHSIDLMEIERISSYINTLVKIISWVDAKYPFFIEKEDIFEVYDNVKTMSKYNWVTASMEIIKKQIESEEQKKKPRKASEKQEQQERLLKLKEELKEVSIQKEELEDSYQFAYEYFDGNYMENQARAA